MDITLPKGEVAVIRDEECNHLATIRADQTIEARVRVIRPWPPSSAGTGGFSEIARQLSEHYGVKVSRTKVYQWYKRKTLNAAGQPFPREAEQGAVPYQPGP